MYDEYDPDDYEDELQRILEGRDVEDDITDVPVDKSKGSTKASAPKKQRLISIDDDEGVPRREDDDLDNFIENDYEEGEEPADAREDRDDEAKEVPVKKVRGPRRVTLNPRPKLDADRLKSTKGLVALLDLHSQIKLKGEGYEEADLNTIMFALEHWAHRLFPKLSFDDFIEKAETLGSKRQVTTFLRKIRMDLPLDVGDEYIQRDDDDDMVDSNANDNQVPVTAESLFDEIVGASNNTSNGREEVSSSDKSTCVNTSTSESAVSLTEEQREIIALKRLAAIEKRKQREEEIEREKQSSQLVSADEMFALMNMDM